MLSSVRELADRLRRLAKAVRAIKAKQVFQKLVREQARETVDEYFRTVRDRLVAGGFSDENLGDLDSGMHRLLEVAQRNSTVKVFRDTIKGLSSQLLAVEKRTLGLRVTPGARTLDPVDQLIIETLEKLLPSAASSYEQAIIDLRSLERLSWRGPATDFRESLRETLDHLAPDDAVAAEPGFKLEKDTTGATMKQKVRFILRKRGVAKAAMQSPESAAQAVDEIVGTFVRGVYSRSSVSTHTPTNRNEILRIRDWVRIAICELLEVRVGA